MNNKGIIFTISSAVIFGIAPIFASMSYLYGNTALNMTFFRNFFTVPVFIILCKKNGISLKIGIEEFKKMLVISLFGSLITGTCLYEAYTFVGVGTTTTIHFMYPFIVCLANALIFKERIGKYRTICLIVCLVGVAFFVDINDINNIKGIIIALISAISYAFFILYLDKKRLADMHPYVFCFYLSSIVSTTFLVFNIFKPIIIIDLSLKTYILMIIAALGTSYLASVLFNVGVKEIGSSKAAIFSLFEPVFSVVFSALLLKETINIFTATGCALLVAGILGLSIYDMRMEKNNIAANHS